MNRNETMLAVGLEVESERRRGDDVEIECIERTPPVLGARLDAGAHLG